MAGIAHPLGKVYFFSAPEGDCFLISNWESSDSIEVFLVTCPCMSAVHPLTTFVANVQDVEFAMVLLLLEVQSIAILLGIFEESAKAVRSLVCTFR